MVTRKQKIQEIPMPTWFIQRVEEFAINDGQDLSKGNEPLLIDNFANNNDFAATLHESGISGVVKDNNDQNNDDDSNADE